MKAKEWRKYLDGISGLQGFEDEIVDNLEELETKITNLETTIKNLTRVEEQSTIGWGEESARAEKAETECSEWKQKALAFERLYKEKIKFEEKLVNELQSMRLLNESAEKQWQVWYDEAQRNKKEEVLEKDWRDDTLAESAKIAKKLNDLLNRKKK